MRKWILGGLAALALCAPSFRASAQGGLERPEHPFALRLGVLWPTDSGVRNNSNSAIFDLGLDYAVGRNNAGNDWVASLDFGTESHLNYWALQAIYMFHNAGVPDAGHRFSMGLGLGAYLLDPDVGDHKTGIGVPIVGDWDFTSRLFLEGKYHWVISHSEGTALSLQLGYRF